MRKYLMLVLGLGALIAVTAVGIATAAGGEGPVTVKVGTLELTAGGGFSPKALSKTKQTPITFFAEGEVKESDNSHPPAIREVVIEADKATEVHTKGIPTCKEGQIQATETKVAEKNCGSALIGTGTATAEVALPEQRPISVNTKILVFNGGESGGKTTLFVHAYFTDPISGAIVTTVTITKHKHGRFGTLAVAKIPQITGGNGSITKFQLTINKNVDGKNPISAKCEDGKLKAHVLGKFEDGTKAETEIIRTCTPKG